MSVERKRERKVRDGIVFSSACNHKQRGLSAKIRHIVSFSAALYAFMREIEISFFPRIEMPKMCDLAQAQICA